MAAPLLSTVQPKWFAQGNAYAPPPCSLLRPVVTLHLMQYANSDVPVCMDDTDSRRVAHQRIDEWLMQHVLVPLALLAFWTVLIRSMVEFWSR